EYAGRGFGRITLQIVELIRREPLQIRLELRILRSAANEKWNPGLHPRVYRHGDRRSLYEDTHVEIERLRSVDRSAARQLADIGNDQFQLIERRALISVLQVTAEHLDLRRRFALDSGQRLNHRHLAAQVEVGELHVIQAERPDG